MKFLCLSCVSEQDDDDYCYQCQSIMERGGLCIHCCCAKATHDNECLHCLSCAIIDRVDTIENLPLEWQREVSDEVAREVAYRENQRLARAQRARQEFMEMIAMVARAPVECGGVTSRGEVRKQA